jgi:hypothetical protein
MVLLALVVAAAVAAVVFSLDAIVQKAVETVGPRATRGDVKLKSANVSLFAGRAQLNGLVIGNPPGCKTPTAIVADKVSFRIQPRSVFSDKVVVESLQVDAPVLTMEGGLTDNNLTKIEKNLADYCASPSSAPSSGAARSKRTFQVNDLVITGAKLQVNTTLSLGKTITVPIPDIHLTNLGTGPEGITAADVAQRALHAVLASAPAALDSVAKNATELGKKTLGAAKTAVQKTADTLKGLIP